MSGYHSNTDRSGAAGESWVAYALGVNDFDVGQMIGQKAQSTDLLVSKEGELWRIEVKSCSQGRTQAEYVIQNPIINDPNLVYAFVFFDTKKFKKTLESPPKLFLVKSSELKKLKKKIENGKWIISHKGNFWFEKKDVYSNHKDNWGVFTKKKTAYLPPETDDVKIIRSYHILFLKGIELPLMNEEIFNRKEADLKVLKIKEKLREGNSTSTSIMKEFDITKTELKKIKHRRCKIK